MTCDPPAFTCLAGSVCALPPQDWDHSLYCLLHIWQHMCSVQVSDEKNTLKWEAYFACFTHLIHAFLSCTFHCVQ